MHIAMLTRDGGFDVSKVSARTFNDIDARGDAVRAC